MSAPNQTPWFLNPQYTTPAAQPPAPAAQPASQGQFFNVSNQDGIYDIGGQKFKINQGSNPYQALVDNGFMEAGTAPNVMTNPTIQSMGADGKWSDYKLIGGDNRGLHAAAALQDPRFAQWLSQDDPTTQADNLVRGVWARDPAEAFRLYGGQAARKPGGIDKTPDADYFTDEKYWPAQFGIGRVGVDKELTNDTAYVAHQLGLDTDQNAQSSATMARDMSPAAQHERNDPDGPWGQIAGLVGTALMFVPGMQGFGMALNTLNAAANKNPLGVVTGLAGLGGFDIAGGLAGAMEPALGSVGSQIASSALMGGAGAAMSGGSFGKGALTGGLSGGLGQYVNSLGLQPWQASALTGAGRAGISGLVNGKGLDGRNILTGALSSGLGSYVGPSLRPFVQGALSQMVGRGGTPQQRFAAGATTPVSRGKQQLPSNIQQRLAAAKAYYQQQQGQG